MTTETLAGQAPAAPARRLSPLTGIRNSLTLTWRSILKIRTNSEDLLGLSLQPIMFLLLFTYVFGGAIAHGSVHAYLEYVLPGIIVQTVLFATLGTGLMLNRTSPRACSTGSAACRSRAGRRSRGRSWAT